MFGLTTGGAARIVLLAAIVFSVVSVDAQAEYFTINRFHSDIEVHEDATCTVVESIEVTFHRERHGIFRDIPYKYRTDLGETIRMPIDVAAVTDNRGNAWQTKVERTGNVVHIRIGDPDQYVDGRQVYVITYTIENALLFFDRHDELYWNVTGDEWEAVIEEASATIRLPSGADTERFQYGCYTGRRGSTDTSCVWEVLASGAAFRTLHPLGANEGFTIALGWNKGVVTPPSAWQQFLWRTNIRDNWTLIVPVFVLLFMIRQWWRYGRDPKVREAITVQYDPPAVGGTPITPAEAGALVDERLDPRDITASVISLAVKGYLRIEEKTRTILIFESTDYELTRLKEADSGLGPFEARLLAALFPAGAATVTISELKNKFYKHLPALKSAVQQMLMDKKYFAAAPDKVRGRYVMYAVLVAIGVFVVGFATAESVPFRPIIAAIASAFIVALFGVAMPAKTRLGAEANMHVRGFQTFMERVEKDQLERMGEKDLFYRHLPYAIALNVADQWAGAFEGIYNQPPDWYRSSRGFTHFSTSSFTHSLSAATASMSSAMYSAPRSSGTRSGGGGGGFSGGGGGGGGGGSW